MGTTSEKLTYLNTTKNLIKDNLNLGGANISNEPFRVYSSKLIDIYKDFLANGTDVVWNNWLPKVNGTGENITLNNTIEAKMDFVYKGNTSQYSTTGKNLFDISTITSITNGTISDEIITTNETSNSTYSVFPYFSNISLPANTYYLSMDIRIKSGTGYFNKINDAANDWAVVSKPSLSTTFQRYVASHTYTSGTTLNHILIQFISSTNAVYEIKNIMISTSSDTTYEPYTNGASPNPDYPQDIQVVSGDNTIKVEGKNLFDISQTPIVINTHYDSRGTLLVWNNYVGIREYVEVTPNTTYVQSNNLGLGITRVCFYDNAKTFLSAVTANSFTTPNNAKYIRFSIYSEGNVLPTWLQIEKGSTATTYEPYQSQTYPINIGNIELCKIGDYQDKIYKDSGKWYLHKQIYKYTFTGTENPQIDTSSINTTRCYYGSILSTNNSSIENCTGLANYLVGKLNWNPDEEGIYSNGRDIVFRANKTTIGTTKTEINSWLSNHNLIYYYVLATPTYEEITDTTLISQLEAIKKSYNTQTNISQTNADKPFILDVVALGELESI